MRSPAEDIAHMLEAAGDSSGLGISMLIGTDLFCFKEPAKPDDTVTIFDTPGFPPYLGLSGDTGYEYPSVQIRVRNRDYRTGWALIESIKDSLHGRHGETWNGTLYTIIYCSSGPAQLDWDDNGNVRLVLNLNLQRRPA